MAYYYVEDIEASLDVIHMLKTCSKYFPVPTVADGDELHQKLENLDKLYTIWTEDVVGDSSYQSEVYKRICEMFSENVFRHLPLSSYVHDDEISTETMWEFKQLNPVYKVFTAFLNLTTYDQEKLEPYVDKRFVKSLIRRLDSCVEAERDFAKQIVFQLFEKATYLRTYIVQDTVDSLIDYGHISINGGVKELLELFKMCIRHKLVDSKMIKKVLSPLMKRIGLCHYAGGLHECIETAVREVNVDLLAWFVDYAIVHWSVATADVPSLCRTLAALYFDIFGREWRRQTRGAVVGHVAGRLQTAVADDETTVAACRAYVEFVDRLIDDAAAATAADSEMERVATALIAVHRTHRDYHCVHNTGRLLRRLVSGGDVGSERRLVDDACRLAVMEVLVEDRSRTMIDNLVDNTF